MDTDSFLIGADGFDITKELNGDYLKKYIDTSNFPKSHAFYSEDNKGVMGLWKSETGSNQIKEVVCLAPKAYSVLMQDGTLKQAAKGVSASSRKVLNHSLYVDALMSNTVTKVPNANITSKKNVLYTTQCDKIALCLLDRKRFWIDENTSVAYGHRIIPESIPKIKPARMNRTRWVGDEEEMNDDEEGRNMPFALDINRTMLEKVIDGLDLV